jgi:hypothetical protein
MADPTCYTGPRNMKIFNSFSKETGLEWTPASNHATTGTQKVGIPNAAIVPRMMRRFTSSTEGLKMDSGSDRVVSPAALKGDYHGQHPSKGLCLGKVLQSSFQGDQKRPTTTFFNRSLLVGFCMPLVAFGMGLAAFRRQFDLKTSPLVARWSPLVARPCMPNLSEHQPPTL